MAKIRASGINQGDLYNYLNNLRTRPLGNPGLAIESGHAYIEAVNEIDYTIDGVIYTLAASTNVDAGSGTKCIATYWNIMIISADTSLALDGTWAGSEVGWANETEAIAQLPTITIPASQCAIGYVTLQAHATEPWISGTDEFTGGGTGDIAATTTCYDIADVNNLSYI